MRNLDQILEHPANADEQMLCFAAQCSAYALRWLRRDAFFVQDLLQNIHTAWNAEQMQAYLHSLNTQDDDALKHALRILRQRVMLRTLARDLNGLADLNEVVLVMTTLAEVTVNHALHVLTPPHQALYGAPRAASNGEQQAMIVVGMGKLGGGELNASSDIDLIFAYEEEGETDGRKQISNQEYFARLGKKLIAAIDEPTADGFVFRVDMRLRPYGSEGPLACSLDMMEEYYLTTGREWERYAWIKGRVIAGPYTALRRLLKPFVFRKYLDYGAIGSIRDLKVQIQRDVVQRNMQENIKLGLGGIREIEFIAQVFQLIRGGQDTALQIRPTLQVLNILQQRQVLAAQTVRDLTEAYVFLRNLEHRLQYLEDQQTQDLPTNETAQAVIAKAMRFDDWASFKAVLNAHRQKVQTAFNALFADNAESGGDMLQALWQGTLPDAQVLEELQNLGYLQPQQALERLRQLQQSSRYQHLPETSRQRFDRVMPLVIRQAAEETNPDDTLLRMMSLLESICRRASYLALLTEYPDALRRVVRIVASSTWLTQYLTQHPILLDELLHPALLYDAPDFAKMRQELHHRLQAAEGDTERQMDIMRHFKHAAVFRFAAQDIAGQLKIETLSDYLSELAEVILQTSIATLWPQFKQRHQALPQFAIIGYGKLGSKELGYTSDLDMVFIYDDAHDNAQEIYARFGQRLTTWLNSMTSAGVLYETDLALRPDGASGMLVSSLAAYQAYQQNKAWVWEHQALTRARFVAGDVKIGENFEQIRQQILQQPRDIATLRADILHMRQKMHDAHRPKAGLFDLKQDSGGLIDIEFIAQYLILAHAGKYAELTKNAGNISILRRSAQLGLIDTALAESAVNTYRQLRAAQHAAGLQGNSSGSVAENGWKDARKQVQQLWQLVFGG